MPDGATTSENVRFAAFSQSSVQNDQSPTQSMFGGQSSSPGRQYSATGHGEPRPEWGTSSDQVRFSASSHCSVQFAHAPTQSMLRGQPPSPGLQDVGKGQREPLPDRGVVTVKVRLAAISHKAVHSDQKPLQSTLAGHSPSPGRHDSASGHRAPNPPCACVSVQVRMKDGSHSGVQLDQDPRQSKCTMTASMGHPPSPA